MAQEEKQVAKETDVQVGFDSQKSFGLVWQQAQAYAASTMVPKEFRGNASNCMIAIELAHRTKSSVFSVMQNIGIINGRPSFSAKFKTGCINSSGKFSVLRYEWKGKEQAPDWGCRAYATDLRTGEVLYGTWITKEMAEKEGWWSKKNKETGKETSKWQSMPEQMFRYRAASFFVDAYAPEISLGMYTTDELEDMGEPKYAGNNFEDAQAEMNAEVAHELEAPKAVDFSSDAQMEVPQEVMQEAPAPVQQAKAEAPKATRPVWANR